MIDLLIITVALSAPLILAAIGGFASERAGVINIGLEGKMLMAAGGAAIGGIYYGPVVGAGFGIASAVALSMLHWLATQHFRIDHIISGMVVNALALGGTRFLLQRFPPADVPHLNVQVYYLAAFLLPLLVYAYVRTTRGGLWLLAVGSDPGKARLAGIRPVNVRLLGLLATGVFTGLAGVQLISYTGQFTDNMTAGRGFIALAALIIGGWRPIPAALACLGFGFFSALRLVLQGTTIFGFSPPSELWAALPYLVTVIALAGFLGRSRTPAGLGKP
jgi:general nucleoside transport system permease protein